MKRNLRSSLLSLPFTFVLALVACDSGLGASSESHEQVIGGPKPVQDAAASDADAGVAVPCKGWCWVNPTPEGNTLRAAWGANPSDLWLVGRAGTIMHFDGTTLLPQPRITTEDLNAVWGSSSSDIWAVGDNKTTLHYDGTVWTKVPNPAEFELSDVWGTSPSDVWAVGRLNLLHWNGSAWSKLDAGTGVGMRRVRGTAGGVAILGSRGELLSYDGAVWTRTPLPESLMGPYPHNFFAVSMERFGPRTTVVEQSGGVFDFEADKWTPGPAVPLEAGEYVSATAVLDGLLHVVTTKARILVLDSGAWKPLASISMAASRAASDQRTFALFGTSLNGAWLFGTFGQAWRNEGGQWMAKSGGEATDLTAIWAPGPNDGWVAAADGRVWRSDGTHLTKTPTGLAQAHTIWGAGIDDVWVGGYGDSAGLSHYDGKTWTPVVIPSVREISAVYGTSATNVWALGVTPPTSPSGEFTSQLLHWNGAAWSVVTPAPARHSLWVDASGEVWVAGAVVYGEFGSVSSWNGTSWTEREAMAGPMGYPAPSRLAGAANGALDSLLGVSPGSHFHRWRGAEWLPCTADPYAVNATAPCGQPVFQNNYQNTRAIASVSATDQWVVGETLVSHWNGAAWTDERLPIESLYYKKVSVAALPSGEAWLATYGGALLHRAP